MNRTILRAAFAVLLLLALMAAAQETKTPTPGVLSPQDIKRLVPTSYFFDGQSAPVQVRNAVGFRSQAGKLVLAGLVDSSGYAADVQQKYQGFLITETKLNIEGSELEPGEYGFGFTKDGKFVVMNVAAADLFNVGSQNDEKLARPVPLKMVEEGGAYKLYAGRKYVTLQAK